MDIPVEDVKPTPEEIAEQKLQQQKYEEDKAKELDDLRRHGYQTISDPVFFQWQRGEKTEQDWKDAIQQVNDLYPITS